MLYIKNKSLYYSTIASGEYWKYSTGQKNGVNAYGYKSAESEPIWMRSAEKVWAKSWGLDVANFGHDPRSSDSLRRSRNFLVVRITHDFTNFPWEKFYDIWTEQRRSVSPCKLSKQIFERNPFSKKCKNCSQNFQVLRLQAVITPQWLSYRSLTDNHDLIN